MAVQFPPTAHQFKRTYKLGKLNGTAITYTRNGQVLEEAEYKDNRRHGKYIRYNENTRKVEQHLIFENGMLLKTVTGKP